MKIILDCNIYDKLRSTDEMVVLVKQLIQTGRLSVLVTPTLWKELQGSPHADFAKELPVVFIGESVLRAGGQVGDRTGSGALASAHYGNSKNLKNFKDALIADAAQHDADYLVTEDNRRLRPRMNKLAVRGRAITYTEFQEVLRSMVASNDS